MIIISLDILFVNIHKKVCPPPVFCEICTKNCELPVKAKGAISPYTTRICGDFGVFWFFTCFDDFCALLTNCKFFVNSRFCPFGR